MSIFTGEDFAIALAKMPETYKKLPWSEIRIAWFKDVFYMCHNDHPPIRLKNGNWEKFETVEIPPAETTSFTHGEKINALIKDMHERNTFFGIESN